MRMKRKEPKQGYKLVSYLGVCLEVPEYTTHIAVDRNSCIYAYDNEPDNAVHHPVLDNIGCWAEDRAIDGYEMRCEYIGSEMILENAAVNWVNSVRAVMPWVKYPRCLFAITEACCDGDMDIGLELYNELEHLIDGDTTNIALMFHWYYTPQGVEYWRSVYCSTTPESLEHAFIMR